MTETKTPGRSLKLNVALRRFGHLDFGHLILPALLNSLWNI